MKRPQYVFRPNLNDPQHRRAWALLQQVPPAKRKEFLVQSIKAKKKAEMDAKKALIRAEDMKKGVFSTIGQLPKEEPRKGSIAASAAV